MKIPCFDTTVMSVLEILEKSAIWAISSFTSHNCRGFQLTLNVIESEMKWYVEYYNISI